MWPERFCFSENGSPENSAEEGRCAVALIKGELPKLTANCLQFTSVLSVATCTANTAELQPEGPLRVATGNGGNDLPPPTGKPWADGTRLTRHDRGKLKRADAPRRGRAVFAERLRRWIPGAVIRSKASPRSEKARPLSRQEPAPDHRRQNSRYHRLAPRLPRNARH